MWKDKGLQLVMLPTENESNLSLDIYGRLYLGIYPKGTPLNQCLYLLSDEEIKEGDCCICNLNNKLTYCRKKQSVTDNIKAFGFSAGTVNTFDYYFGESLIESNSNNYKKVIVSTNPSINLPQFPNAFIEEYVKRYNSKKSLEVEVEYIIEHDLRTRNKEEEFKEVLVIKEGEISIRFKEEKMYRRSEVEELCGKAFDAGEAYRTGSCEGFKQIHPNKYEWIKENLK